MYDFKSGLVKPIEITKGTEPDQSFAKLIHHHITANSVAIYDRGYFSIETFKNIENQKAFFVTRYHSGNILMFRHSNGSVSPLDLVKLLHSKEMAHQTAIEVDVSLGGATNHNIPIRLIAIKLDKKAKAKQLESIKAAAKRRASKTSKKTLKLAGWMIILTNLPIAKASAVEVGTLYRVRWQIELVFRQLKSNIKIHKTHTANESRLLFELYSKLIACILLHAWHADLNEQSLRVHKREISFEKMGRYWVEFGSNFAYTFINKRADFEALVYHLKKVILNNARKHRQRSRLTTYELLENPEKLRPSLKLNEAEIIKICPDAILR